MKNYIFWIIFSIIWFDIQSQINFEFTNSDSPIEVGLFALENQNGNFIISSTKREDLSERPNIVLFELNQNGELINSAELSNTGSAIITRMFEMEDHYLSLGISNNTGFDSTFFQVLEISFDFEILSDTFFYIGPGALFTLNGSLLNDTIYCVSNLSEDSVFDPVVIKMTPPHEIHMINTEIDFSGFISSITIDENTNHHIICGADRLGIYDQNFNYVQAIDFPLGFQGTLKTLSDTTFLATGRYIDGSDPMTPTVRNIGVALYDFSFELLKLEHFGMQGDTIDLMAPYHSVDFVEQDKIYVGGTGNRLIAPIELINEPSYFILSQFDEDLNKNWERRYGGDAFYEMNTLHATQDGGCIMIGLRRDYINTPDIIELYVLKVDGNGGIVSTTTIPLTKEIAKTYPNPFQNYLQIDITEKKSNIEGLMLELVDLNGRVVIQQDIDNWNIALSTSSFTAGAYFVLIKDENGKVIWKERIVKI